MIKTMKNGDLRAMGLALGQIWNTKKHEIKMTGKNTLYLLKLKSEIDKQNVIINDAFMAIGSTHGGTMSEEGNMTIPKEEIEAVNKELREIAEESTDIEYTPLKIEEDDQLPLEIMEILLPFIDLED